MSSFVTNSVTNRNAFGVYNPSGGGAISIDDLNSINNAYSNRNSDLFGPGDILGDTTNFSNSIGGSSAPSSYFFNGVPFGRNASALDILRGIDRNTQGLEGGAFGGFGMDIPTFDNYYQPVPNLGYNPSGLRIMASSHYFLQGIQTEQGAGPLSTPGFNFYGASPSADTILLMTQMLQSNVIPVPNPIPATTPVTTPPYVGSMYPLVYYTPWGQMSEFGPPLGEPVYTGPIFSQPPILPVYQPPVSQSVNMGSYESQLDMVSTLLRDYFDDVAFPDAVPLNAPGGVINYLFRFSNADEAEQTAARTTMANPTVVNETILNSAGITSTGGLYNQGVVTNPFIQDGFLTDSNPFAIYQSGLLVTNGNGNGKVLGTVTKDTLFGGKDRTNIIDGRGGSDEVVGGSVEDLIKVNQGDVVASLAGNDTLFFDFGTTVNPFALDTVLDAGAGDADTVIITVDDNPSEENVPVFTTTAGSDVTKVAFNGKNLYAKGVERYIVIDRAGNIGSIFESVDANA